MRYWLGLGSNEGDPAARLAEALRRLRNSGVRIIRKSRLYRTEPVGLKDQAWFVNQALEVETELRPSRLLGTAKKIEKEMGRKSGPRNGPRPIDIDILLAESAVRKTASLEIPHPRLALRKFVLVPLADIAPNIVHPILKKSVRGLLRSCPDRSKIFRVHLLPGKKNTGNRV